MQVLRTLCAAALAAVTVAQNSTTNQTAPQVDLGYALYQGTVNATAGHNIYRGIRFAAAPTGDLRWREPVQPQMNRTVQMADGIPFECPQAAYNGGLPIPAYPQSEDCLFLNVYAPQNASSLPVLVWIHGGGYGLGNASQYPFSNIISTNNNSFILVALQYRLGAFGFLSSDEVARFGTANAGIYDMKFGLQWVQKYIHLFGGDPAKVTVSGESAGAGGVMLMTLANGGTLGNSLFRYAIAASPYLPMQYGYRDWVPTQSYYAFAAAAGCPANVAYGNTSTTIIQCLRNQSYATLQNASTTISASGRFDTWSFLPVTDGKLVMDQPSKQLLEKKVNGERLLTGNNAEEGAKYTPQNIKTEDDLVAYLRNTFPQLQNSDIAKILLWYPSPVGNASVNASQPLYATDGINPPTTLFESDIATGQQARANAIYGETTFICSSYWMAEAYTNNNRAAYKYQYSVGPALHALDLTAYFGPPTAYQAGDFSKAFMEIFGNFVTTGNPSISNAVANGASSNSTAMNPAANWPQYQMYAPYMLDLNTTGGTVTKGTFAFGPYTFNLTERVGPNLQNNFTLVNAYTWEGGRGFRCDFWRSIGAIVPE